MLLSLKWLRDFVPYEGDTQQLADHLTMLGLELDDIQHPYESISDIVVGHILECTKHPDSDHMSVCTVDVGQNENLTIVCGAPNVAAGQTVPVALVGTTMPDGTKIKKAKLRGVPSSGMICSERELGLSEDHSGILVLPENFHPGEKLVDALALDKDILDISITPNRADCLSVLGLAREVALAFHLPLKIPEYNPQTSGTDFGKEWSVTVPQKEFCPFYQLRLVENITIKPSPMWLRYRLHSVGIRAISNIVDVTNLVLMELGQPLHAFDWNKVQGGCIEVSPAKDGETIVTLDGQERKLSAGDILIRDGVHPVALAGIMGGLDTEITDTSRNVMIESAIFRPASIRRTARRLGLSSEASYRFERGVDQTGCTRAINRAAMLMAELGEGQIRSGYCTRESQPWIAPVPRFRMQKAEDLLGIHLDADFCKKTFESLGCHVDQTKSNDWAVSAPGWRQDLTREADLIEEVARVHGMDEIPETLPAIKRELNRFGLPESRFACIGKIRAWGSGLGLNEAENYSFVSQKELDRLGIPAQGRIAIVNPLTEEQNVLRTEIAPSLLQNVRQNINHDNAGVRLFEVANVFRHDPDSETTAYEETHLGIVLYGSLYDSAWAHKAQDAGYADLRGVLEHFLKFLHLPVANFSAAKDDDPLMQDYSYLAPLVRITLPAEKDEDLIGIIGRVRSDLADDYQAHKAIWLAEINLEKIMARYEKVRIEAESLPVFPAARRDMTITAPAGMSAAAIAEQILHIKSAILESVDLVDLYESEETAGRNLTFRLTFRRKDRTLKDNEADRERERLASLLVKNLGVKI